jgi:hypothetical protein
VTFRERLLGTLRLLQPILDEPGVLVVGSEVPNLLQPGAASTLVVSQDVDLAIPIESVGRIKAHLRTIAGLVASTDEPSIYVPSSPALIEANFLGLDAAIRDASETYLLDDPELPLMVFGPIGLLRPGPVIEVDGLRIPLPRPADLMVEKLLTDRTGEKGARDLLVVAALLATVGPAQLDEVLATVYGLSEESRYTVRSSLTLLSLMESHVGMPDPSPFRAQVTHLIARIEGPTSHGSRGR